MQFNPISAAGRMMQMDVAIERWVTEASQCTSQKYTLTHDATPTKAPDPRGTALAHAISRTQQLKDPRVMGTSPYLGG